MRFFCSSKWLLTGVFLSVLMSGCKKDDDKKEQTTPPPPPVAKFMVMPTSPVTGQLVNFVSTSDNASAFEWDLGKGEPKVFGTTVSTTYFATGNYTVTLRAMGAGGESTTSQTIAVGAPSVAGLKAMFELFDPTGASVRARLDSVTFFNTTISGNVGGQLPTFKWEIFNAAGVRIDSSFMTNYRYAFNTGGEYRVKLTATIPTATDTASTIITAVAPASPTAVLVRPTDTTVIRGSTFSLTEKSRTNISDFLTINLTLKVLFGDSLVHTAAFSKTTTSDLTMNWNVPVTAGRGVYKARLIATNQFGTDSTEFNFLVRPRPTVASFTNTPEVVLFSNDVTFNNTSTGDSLSYVWNINGQTHTTKDVTFSVPTLMTQFSVVLIVTGDGGTDTLSRLINASDPGGIIANFNFPTGILNARNSITFTNASSNATRYSWDFGVAGTDSDTSDAINPSYIYDNPGTYTVTLTAFDGANNSQTVTKQVTVVSPYDLYVLDFTTNPADRRIVMIDVDKASPDFNNIGDADTMSVPNADISLTYADGNLYYVDNSTSKLMRRATSDFVGTTIAEVYTFTTLPNAIKAEGGKIYWITSAAVHRMNLDGTGVEMDFITSPNTGADFRDLFIDNSYVYVNDVINSVTLNGIYRASNSAGATLTQQFVSWLYGFTISGNNYYYFANDGSDGNTEGAVLSRTLSNPTATPTVVANALSPKGRILFVTAGKGKLFLSNRSPNLHSVNISGTSQTQTPVLLNYNWGDSNRGPRQSFIIE